MANQELVQLLRRSVREWNGYRVANPDIEINLRGAHLFGVNLSVADLREVDLRGANLGGTNLSGAKLGGAVFDQGTRWPNGFQPEAAGALRDTSESAVVRAETTAVHATEDDVIDLLAAEVARLRFEADRVGNLEAQLAQAQVEIGRVAGLEATLESVKAEADRVEELEAQLAAAQADAVLLADIEARLAAEADAARAADLDAQVKSMTSGADARLPVARSVREIESLELSESDELADSQIAALTASIETLLGEVRRHLADGSWSPAHGFELGVEEDVKTDADYLQAQLRRLSDAPPDWVVVARIESALQSRLRQLVPDDLINAEVLDAVLAKFGLIDGLDDLDDAIAAADGLAFAARWDDYQSEFVDDPDAWERFIGDLSDPIRIFSSPMGWVRDTDLTWLSAARATGLVVAAVAGGVGFTAGVTTAGAVVGAGSIVTAIVASIVWYLRARLQPAVQSIPTGTSDGMRPA